MGGWLGRWVVVACKTSFLMVGPVLLGALVTGIWFMKSVSRSGEIIEKLALNHRFAAPHTGVYGERFG